MKVPEPRKLKNGKWFIQLRLGGESISVSNFDKNACIREARAIKAEHQIGKRQPKPPKEAPTLTAAIDAYIASRENVLSPATIRGYHEIQRNRFRTTMPRRLDQVQDAEWQNIVNAEAALCSPKTLRNAFFFVQSVVKFSTGRQLPQVTLPGSTPAEKKFLTPEQIRVFVQAVKNHKHAVPALLALSSMRASEIAALRWENIPNEPDFIQVSGAAVTGDGNVMHLKPQNKNETSNRKVPILIPELREAIRRDRKPIGPVLTVHPTNLYMTINRICKANDLPEVGVHGLRHSFASLAYHLQMPERIAMEIGGWKDASTMRKIYTHIAQSDIERYKGELEKFYAPPKDC